MEAVGDGFRLASSVLEAFFKAWEEPVLTAVETIGELANRCGNPQQSYGMRFASVNEGTCGFSSEWQTKAH